MDTILIPTDFSEAAENATEYALQFFNGRRCNFRFLNTYTPDFVHSRVMAVAHSTNMEEDMMQRRSEEGLSSLVAHVRDRYPEEDFSFETTSSFNLLTQEIREQLAEQPCDLVVSGTVGSSGLKEIFLGSNTVRILRTVRSCPVLVIPAEARFRVPRKIGFVTDFAWPFSALQLEQLYKFTRRFDSELEIMHIGYPDTLSSSQDLHRRQLMLELNRFEPEMIWMPPQAGKSEIIQEYLRNSSIDMLVMVKNEHNPIEELLREPVVKRIAFHTGVPFLVLPPANIG